MKTATLQISSLIPEEIIIFEILTRLPVKTLCRFRAVSKRWLSFITSRPFIDSHFQHSNLNPTFLFGFYTIDATTTPKFLASPYHQTSNKWDRKYGCYSISPRGLICFYGGDPVCRIQIWNPSTGKHIGLNPPPRKYSTPCHFFLGFDPVSKKHKILSSCSFENYVFTIGEKNWRKITGTESSSRNTAFSFLSCCIDGILYYLVLRDQNEFVLVVFDVVSERFLETITVPEKVAGVADIDSLAHAWFRVYRGRIVFLHSDSSSYGFRMSVLEDVEKQKWSPKRLIPWPQPHSPDIYNYGFINGEELLFFSSELNALSEANFRLCIYDLEKLRLRRRLDGNPIS